MIKKIAYYLIVILFMISFSTYADLYAQTTGGNLEEGAKFVEPSHEREINCEAMSHYRKGREFFNEGKFEIAVEEYKKALEIAPEFDFAYGSLGHVLYRLEKYEESLAYFLTAIKFSPSDDFYYGEVALVYMKLNNREKAIESLKAAMDLAPANWVHWYNYGALKIVNNEIDEGRNALEQALKLCKSRQYRIKIREKLKEQESKQ